MRSVEASAKTRKDAIQKALDALRVELYEVEIEIIDEGSKGLFGIGAREVRVKVSTEVAEEPKAKPRESREPRAQRPDRKPRSQQDRKRRDENDSKRPAEAKGERGRQRPERKRAESGGGGDERKPRRSGDERKGGREGAPREGATRDSAPREGVPRDGAQRDGGRDRGSDRRGARRPEQQRAKTGADNVEAAPRPRPERPERPERSERPERGERPKRRNPDRPINKEKAEHTGSVAAALLEEVITKMGMESTVKSSLSDDNDIVLTVESPDSAILIGRKGRNLSAMQFLINRMVMDPEDEEGADRIIVDVEGYLDRRKSSLDELAQRMAERAKETGRAVRINKPLTPQERRMIHLALEDDEDVETHSLGSAVNRRVVIVPKGGDVNDVEDSEPSREPRRGRDGDRRGPRRGGPRRDRDSRDDGGDRYERDDRDRAPARAAQSQTATESAADSASGNGGERSGSERPRGGRGTSRPKPGARGKIAMPYKVDVSSAREQPSSDNAE